jgi:hypothetical protein
MHSPAAWSRQDLFFLEDALRCGGSIAEVAAFLSRDENEELKLWHSAGSPVHAIRLRIIEATVPVLKRASASRSSGGRHPPARKQLAVVLGSGSLMSPVG